MIGLRVLALLCWLLIAPGYAVYRTARMLTRR
jgi:hypothetical protein